MKKRLLLSIAIGIMIMGFLGDQYLKRSYQISMIEYIKVIQPFTKEETERLNSMANLIYGSDSNSPPLRYIDPETHQYKGLVVDYLDALSLELGGSIEFTPMVWKDALKALSDGTIDICDMNPSKERSLYYDFSTPFYAQRGVILTRADSPVQTEADLKGHRLSGTDGDYAFEYLQENHPDSIIITASDLEEAITLLLSGNVDAVIGDESVISYFIDHENYSDRLYISNNSLYVQDAVIAVKKGNDELLSAINKGIARLNTKNTMEKIYHKWYGEQPLVTKDLQQVKWQFFLQLSVVLLLLSFTIFYYWNRELTREVNKRTKALNASTQVLEATFNGLQEFLIVLDEHKNLIEFNNSFQEFMQQPKKALKNTAYDTIPLVVDTPIFKSNIDNAYTEISGFQQNFHYMSREYKAISYPLSSDRKSFKLLLLIDDITDSVIQQQQLLQSRKMVAVGQLAAGVAHEIRNPIGLIRNHSFLLKRQLKSTMTADVEESLTIMDASVDRVNSIINNLLNFSKQNGHQKTTIFLKEFTEELLDLNKKSIEQKNAHLMLRCPDQLSAEVYVESMKHIIINLVTNGLEAIENGGTLTLQFDQAPSGFTMIFSDDGHGIPKDILPTIFDPFFTTKAPDKGTGLGLYIVYNEVKKMNGSITVESEASEGTAFTLFIPSENPHQEKEAIDEQTTL